MAKLKGMRKLNKAITAPLAQRFGITEAICADEFAYYWDTETITYKLTDGELEDKWFNEFIEERFDYKVKNSFVISLLHEVGHHKANEEICDAIAEFCEAEKERIEEAMKNAETEEECKKLEWQYFNLPDEIMATQWAVNYAKKHPRIVNKIWRQMQNALVEFYKANLDKIDLEEMEA